jgi:hypothetical protein
MAAIPNSNRTEVLCVLEGRLHLLGKARWWIQGRLIGKSYLDCWDERVKTTTLISTQTRTQTQTQTVVAIL